MNLIDGDTGDEMLVLISFDIERKHDKEALIRDDVAVIVFEHMFWTEYIIYSICSCLRT